MEGRHIPLVTFKTRIRDESIGGPNPFRWQDVRSDEIFGRGRVVVFSLPGAFTPTCSNKQCPSFDLLYPEIRKHDIDEVYCISVNDAFVMYQWGKSLNLKHIKPVPDGSGHFTRRMGMLINKDRFGMGYRSWRYTMVVANGVIEKWFEEPGINDLGIDNDPYTVTNPDVLLEYLRSRRAAQAAE